MPSRITVTFESVIKDNFLIIDLALNSWKIPISVLANAITTNQVFSKLPIEINRIAKTAKIKLKYEKRLPLIICQGLFKFDLWETFTLPSLIL